MEGYHENIHEPFKEALQKDGIHLICEVKKASPSKGLIAKEFDYLRIAKEYEAAGASAISVLTEPTFFLGRDTYLKEIHEHVKIPILRKDFVIDSYQIYEAKILGASCVLLICAILSQEQLREYLAVCKQIHLSALVEVHNEDELEVALECGAAIIGVNNRNLKDFTVDITNSIRVRRKVPKDILFVAESGIETKHDIRDLYEAEVNGVLIGETLMRSENKVALIKELTSLCNSKS